MTKARRKRRAFVVSRVRCSGRSLAAHGSNHVVCIDKHPQAVLAQLPRDDGGRGDRVEQARPASLLEPAGGGFVVGLADGPLQAGITAAAVAGNGVGPGVLRQAARDSGSRTQADRRSRTWRQTLCRRGGCRQAVSPRWSSVADADIGGFGLGRMPPGSCWPWPITRPVSRYSCRWATRHQPLDYRDKGKRLGVALSGPMLGLTWRLGLPAAPHRP